MVGLDEYDARVCAIHCSESNQCKAFNLAVMRYPIINPVDDSCEDPPAQPVVLCTLLSEASTKEPPKTEFQIEEFEIIAAGSNGKPIPTIRKYY